MDKMDEVRGAGRPKAPLSEMVFSCIQKVYEQLASGRGTEKER